ncbi:tRNA (adenosine(37)-N6)-threonylcarbamoyltransferase complex dimerization subunit type 1 TsaB [Brachybacterium sp. EF45031]|uniref:tRNA (adenosine(37)-N6)-threonylcarbamoyltransferase complex dimerization subunit type 1 TsaB n=1 Tax=Brachybacterium sillae TaxID=2810536 RepID=UPI00217CC4DE|nr:tRNA (adenosine(37)-N6)-threonylcarbamoyltransferase complex dimerization subunit type 1 TsaB [Brachybacterium sillae]MCS6711187.1 tRNA (adenosine(37)-N6)-threonylcarbamoyltransferase complex dimerization subunit type 1 TsaB [Brachybacterium sillae]
MLLGIDTSGAVSVALAEGELGRGVRVVAARTDERARHHDEVLMGLIDQVLAEAGARRADLTAVVVGRGPGPFTGLRVGLVTARSIAAVLGLPLYGVVSLDALAHEVLVGGTDGATDMAAGIDAAEGSVRPGTTAAVALDARRREVYHARYALCGGRLERTAGPSVDAPAEIAEQLRAADHLVGSGTALYPELLPATDAPTVVDAGHLLRVADLWATQGEDLTSTEPLYLRAPDAAKPTARKSALGR